MALSATPARHIRARAPRSMSFDPRTGRKLVTAFVLARLALLVLSGRAWVNVACPGHDQHGLDHRCTAGRLEVVLLGSTEPAAASTRPAHDPVQHVLRNEDEAGSDRLGSGAMSVQAEEGGLPCVRRAGSASALQATATTVVVAGLVGLLGVGG